MSCLHIHRTFVDKVQKKKHNMTVRVFHHCLVINCMSASVHGMKVFSLKNIISENKEKITMTL